MEHADLLIRLCLHSLLSDTFMTSLFKRNAKYMYSPLTLFSVAKLNLSHLVGFVFWAPQSGTGTSSPRSSSFTYNHCLRLNKQTE